MITRMEGRKAEEYEEEKAASCVSQISHLRHCFANPSGQIEDQRVWNNISKIQLNPTVDEVALIIFPKGVCAVSTLAVFSSGQPESWRSCAQNPRRCVGSRPATLKTRFLFIFVDLFAFFSTWNPRRANWRA